MSEKGILYNHLVGVVLLAARKAPQLPLIGLVEFSVPQYCLSLCHLTLFFFRLALVQR